MRPHATFLTVLLILAVFSRVNSQGKVTYCKHRGGWETRDSAVIKPLNVNSDRDDYSPVVLSDDNLYFNSDRRNDKSYEAIVAYNEHVYFSKRTGDSVWSEARKTYFLNSDDQTSLAGVNNGLLQLFLYRAFENGDLYRCEEKNGYWRTPKRLRQPVNSRWHEQSASEAAGVMVISTDRPGGLGDHDLYWSSNNVKGRYLDFKPLDAVNTEFDEVDVKMDPDGKKLYFSSDRPDGQGGYDIFYTKLDSSGNWGKPVNMGSSMNSGWNDRWFYDREMGFLLSSDRPGGAGGYDLYWGYFISRARQIKAWPLIIIKSDTTHVEITIVKRNIINKSDTTHYFITVVKTPGGTTYDTITSNRNQLHAGVYIRNDSIQVGIRTSDFIENLSGDTLHVKITQLNLAGEEGSDTTSVEIIQAKIPVDRKNDTTLMTFTTSYPPPEVITDASGVKVMKVSPYGSRRGDTVHIEVVKVIPVVASRGDTAYAELTIEKQFPTKVLEDQVISSPKKGNYAMVQIGVYSNYTVESYKRAHPDLKSIPITIETVKPEKGGVLQKFLIDKKFYSLKEAEVTQKEMIEIHHIRDAFIPVYNEQNRRIAIYNPASKEFIMLGGEKKPDPF